MKEFFITTAKVIIIMSLVGFIPTTAGAQEYTTPNVTISKEKVRIDGNVYYSHVVQEKQTLYSICKAYNVNIDDIYRYNPTVKENGLKKNSILLIPAYADEVKTKEARRRTHTVKWYEDIDLIASKYGVSVDAIMKANEFTSRKLTKRLKLTIPLQGEYPDETYVELAQRLHVQADTVSTPDTLADKSPKNIFPRFFFPKKYISASLLLPFNATGRSSSRQNMDFYSGLLLAVYDMQQEGIDVNLNVYDTADEQMNVSQEQLMDNDVVIGPVASGDITGILEEVPYVHALVSPLDPKAEGLAYSHKAVIQAPTPHSIQYDDIVSWLKDELRDGDRVFMVTEKGARKTDAVAGMTAAMDSSKIAYKPLSYSILEGRDVADTLAAMMTDSLTNRVFIASESEAFVNDVVRNLNMMVHQKYDVVLYAPSKIRSFETIEVENFHNTQMRVSAGYYIDYNDPKTKDFLLRYRALFNAEPSQFSYQGYDLGKYFFTLCSKYGNRWMEKLDEEQVPMLQSTFGFVKTENGGYVNNAVRRIVYGDRWSVTKIR